MSIAVSIVAGLLLLLGSGLIGYAIYEGEMRHREDMGRVSEGHWSRAPLFPGEGRRTFRSAVVTGRQGEGCGVRLLGPGSEIGPGRPQ